MRELETRIFTYDEIRTLFKLKGYLEMKRILTNLVAGYHKSLANKSICSQNIITIRNFLREDSV